MCLLLVGRGGGVFPGEAAAEHRRSVCDGAPPDGALQMQMHGQGSQVLPLQFLQQQRLFRPARSVKVSHCTSPENTLWIMPRKAHIFVIKRQKSLSALKINRLVLVVVLSHGTAEGLIEETTRQILRAFFGLLLLLHFLSLIALPCRINWLMIF